MLTIFDLFETIRHVASRESVSADSLTGISRRAYFRARAGDGIAPRNAVKLIEVARKFVSPEVVELVDGAGNHHFAPDFAQQAKATIARQAAELAQHRRVLLTRAKCALSADAIPVRPRRLISDR